MKARPRYGESPDQFWERELLERVARKLTPPQLGALVAFESGPRPASAANASSLRVLRKRKMVDGSALAVTLTEWGRAVLAQRRAQSTVETNQPAEAGGERRR